MPQILIVEDEAAIADTLIFALQSEGFATHWLTLASAAATPAFSTIHRSDDTARGPLWQICIT